MEDDDAEHQHEFGYEQQGHLSRGDLNNNEALFYAVSEDDVGKLKQLLEEGVSADTFYDDEHNISSKSILHIACGKGRTECVE